MDYKSMIGYESQAETPRTKPPFELSDRDHTFLMNVWRFFFYTVVLIVVVVVLSWVWDWALESLSYTVDRTNEVMPKAANGLYYSIIAAVLSVVLWGIVRLWWEAQKDI